MELNTKQGVLSFTVLCRGPVGSVSLSIGNTLGCG